MAMRFMNGLTSIVSAAHNPQLLKTQVETGSQCASTEQLWCVPGFCCRSAACGASSSFMMTAESAEAFIAWE